MRTWGLVALGLCASGIATGAAAQAFGVNPDRNAPVWMRRWSALGSRADLPRRLPSAGTATSGFVFGPPRVGSFWTAGNPAGLVEDARDARTDFQGGFNRQSGDFRRPLDPGTARLVQAAAQSWKGFSPTFSLLGRVTFDQKRLDPGTRSDFTEAFPSSPFVSTDTSASPVRRTRAVLEGVAGWRLGRWTVGITGGYEGRDHLSTVSTTIRRVRSTTPGLVLGIARQLGGIQLGAFTRLRHTAESVLLFTRTGSGRVYELTGYREAPPITLSTSYSKRREQDLSSFGGTLGGHTGRTRWILYAEADRQSERLTRQQQNDPALDRWDQSGWSAGGALQRRFGPRWLLTLHARGVSSSGDADLALDSAGVIFHAEESALEAELELRMVPADREWAGILTLGMAGESRTRRDSTTGLATSVTSGTPSLALELGRQLGPRMFAAVGGALAWYRPTSTIPNPAKQGPIYRYYIGPEYALYSSRSHPTAVSFLMRYRVSPVAMLWTSGRLERLSATDATSNFIPDGSRRAFSITAGVTVLTP